MRYVKKPPLEYEEIKALPPGRHYRGEGLVIIVTPKGRRFYRFRYTSPITNRVTEVSIGEFPYDSYWDALQQVYQMMVLVAKGEDPVLIRRLKRGSGKTLAEAREGWINKRKSSWRSTRHIEALSKHTRSLDQMPIRMITTNMLVDVLSTLWEDYPEQARRVLSMNARIFDYAKSMGYRTGDNPAEWRGCMENIFPNRPKDGTKHFTSMPFKDVPKLMHRLKLRQVKGQSAAALRFLILTAARTAEVLNMQWGEIDWDNDIWTLSPERTKQGRIHRVPLSPQAMEILRLQFEYQSSDFVFPGRNGGALGARALFILLRDMDVFVTVHGFRSSFRDWCAVNKFDFTASEICIAHTVGNETVRAYLRDDLLDERRVIMNEWSKYCG
jgi:integrase